VQVQVQVQVQARVQVQVQPPVRGRVQRLPQGLPQQRAGTQGVWHLELVPLAPQQHWVWWRLGLH
jgi:hypothetical protein